ncbi:MAG: thermonuclease family protein [Alphaproteobacteria bacterium]|jgi:endonuclease YncB( thermonuclease family)|nr:thermonuclease family protein [Alphaproteobacteria bacterium]
MRYLIVVLALLPSLALAQISGKATVVDGDTIEIGGALVRLHGIDAPELAQACEHLGQPWPCGSEARGVLERIIASRTVTCRADGRCRIGPEDLNAEMVVTGMALADPDGGDAYAALEELARVAGRGLWAGRFTAPWDWRAGERLAPATAAERCRIKGDIPAGGRRTYYVPGEPGYEAVEIDAARGERWFCTEMEAIRAGWWKRR